MFGLIKPSDIHVKAQTVITRIFLIISCHLRFNFLESPKKVAIHHFI